MALLNFGPLLSDVEIEICSCKNIYRDTIINCIRGGAKNLQEVKVITKSGSGTCGGKWCTPTIENLLTEYRNNQY